MRREPLSQEIEAYAWRHPGQEGLLTRFRTLLASEPRCFENDCYQPGHFTASALIVNPGLDKVVLCFHGKLHKWLQLGGHADGHPLLHETALREAQEESGLRELRFLSPHPVHWDIHEIPARGGVPAHLHYDVRYLLQAWGDTTLLCSSESLELAWFSLNELPRLDLEESVLTLIETVSLFG